jgi:hypothetical protein
MDIENENNSLKSIIRTMDKRIKYLERRINDIIDKNDIYVCFMCANYCTYDDEKCDYNLFCTNYICKKCIYIIKLEKDNQALCKNNKCNKWYCPKCLYYKKYDCIKYCSNCKISQCNDHYETLNEKISEICDYCIEINKENDIIFI